MEITTTSKVYGMMILISSFCGALYGFWSELNEEKKTKSILTKTFEITASTILFAVIGFAYGLTSPLTFPIAIPAFISVKYKEKYSNE